MSAEWLELSSSSPPFRGYSSTSCECSSTRRPGCRSALERDPFAAAVAELGGESRRTRSSDSFARNQVVVSSWTPHPARDRERGREFDRENDREREHDDGRGLESIRSNEADDTNNKGMSPRRTVAVARGGGDDSKDSSIFSRTEGRPRAEWPRSRNT